MQRPRGRGRFTRHVLTLVTGNGVAQAISVAGTLILARLLAPEAFGLFALFVTVVSLVAVLGGARYELAIMLPESDEEAANILALAALVVTGIAVAAAAVIAGYGFTISYLVGDIRLSPWMWAVPIALFVNGIYQMLALWCARMKRFGRLAATRVTQAFCVIVSQLALLPLLPTGGSALVAGWILGEYTAAIILLAQVLRDDG
ncbi:MAG: lipopolysaccharide biosynthesis protein, partial [Candidatus Acidiferrales bacterium]